jgi:hypothetical protein
LSFAGAALFAGLAKGAGFDLSSKFLRRSPLGTFPARFLRLQLRFARITPLLLGLAIELHIARSARQQVQLFAFRSNHHQGA